MKHVSPPHLPVTESLESRRFFSVSPASIVPRVTGPAPGESIPIINTIPGTGLTGEYFIGDTFQTPVLTRADSTINFKWKRGRPDHNIPQGTFTARWSGKIMPTTSGTYTFYTSTDSGTRVIINGTTIIDNFAARTAAVSTGSIALTAGLASTIEVDYVSRGTGPSRMQFSWTGPGVTRRVVPKSVLYPATVSLPAEPLTGYYYLGASFNKLVMTRADASVNFDWHTGTPDPILRAGTPFSVRWVGNITAPLTGTYTFQSITDDGVRLWVDGVQIIHDWHVESAQSDLGRITLQAGQSYPIRMDYFENGVGHASAKLLVALPGQGRNLKFAQFAAPSPTSPLIPPTTVTAAAFSPTQINLNWNDVSGETGFIVERHIAPNGSFVPVATLPAGTTAFSDTGLTPSTAYDYAIVAEYPAGNSPLSTTAVATTLPSQLAAVVTSAILTSGSTANVTWTADPTATNYLVERSPDGNTAWTAIAETSSTSYIDSTLAPNSTYFYRVTASNVTDQSGPSNSASVSTPTAAPTLSATAVSSSQVNLHWNDVTGETGFVIEQSPDGTGNWTVLNSYGGNAPVPLPQHTTSYINSGLTAATNYYYRIYALSPAGISDFSNVTHAVTSAANPTFASLTTLYGLTGAGSVYSIDTTSGAATLIGALSFGTNAAGRDPLTGNFFYVSTGNATVAISQWNPNNSVNTVVNAAVPLGNPVAQAAFRDDGEFFVTTDTGDLFSIVSTTGAATLRGSIHANGSALACGNGDMAFAPDGTLFIETNSELYSITQAAVDAGAGSGSIITATDVGPTNTPNLQLAFGQSGVLFGTDSTGQLYSINPTTAAAIPLGAPSNVNMGDLASIPLYGDLSIAQTASAFTRGITGSYSITVNNAGPDTTVGPITLVDTLPANFILASTTGTGWSFSLSGSTLTMTYPSNVAAGTSAPIITLSLTPTASAANSATNTIAASTTEFETNIANNISTLTNPVTG